MTKGQVLLSMVVTPLMSSEDVSISDPRFCIPNTLVLQKDEKQSFCCHNDPCELQIFIYLSGSALFCKPPKSRK